MKPQVHAEKRERVRMFLEAGVKLAARKGLANVTRAMVAAQCGVAESLVTHHMTTMVQFRRDIMREAIRTTNLQIIAQGIVARDRRALNLPVETRQAALASLGG